jgi:AAA+ superfamily predicted ATPase
MRKYGAAAGLGPPANGRHGRQAGQNQVKHRHGENAHGSDNRSYSCEVCHVTMPMSKRKAHHTEANTPCQYISCAYCKQAFFRKNKEDHYKNKCPHKQKEKEDKRSNQDDRHSDRNHRSDERSNRNKYDYEDNMKPSRPSQPSRNAQPQRDVAPARERDSGNKKVQWEGEATIADCKQNIYVGEQVRVSGQTSPIAGEHSSISRGTAGEVMYIGPAKFANGRQVVGLKLKSRASGSACDGKQKGERFFRCEPGYGAFVLLEDIELTGGAKDARANSNKGKAKPFDLEDSLTSIVGLDSVKLSLRSVRNRLEVGKKREIFGIRDKKPLHSTFIGSGGMGPLFVDVAHVLSGMLTDLGPSNLQNSKVVAVTRRDIVAASTADTIKLVERACERAAGGVLLVSDMSMPASADGKRDTDHYGALALSTLVSHVDPKDSHSQEDDKAALKKEFVLVLAGKREQISALLSQQPSLVALMPTTYEFAEYTTEQLATLTKVEAETNGFKLDAKFDDEKLGALLGPIAARTPADKGGAVLVKQMVLEAINRQTDRVYTAGTMSKESLLCLVEEDFKDAAAEQTEEAVDAALAELDNIVGLAGVKAHMHSLKSMLMLDQKRRAAGMKGGEPPCLHMIFQGNPGTGKTTVARIVANMLRALGFLRRGHLVETDRSGLVAPYCGQTAIKTTEVVDSALGGMLFVDEAYALVAGDSKDAFGREALDTLIKLVEDHRDNLVVVLAGYNNEMNTLINQNPGVRSRFPTVINFEDYTREELMAIAVGIVKKTGLNLTDGAKECLMVNFQAMMDSKERNGNGRTVRNIIERAMRAQAVRLGQTHKTLKAGELCDLIADDFDGKITS